MEVGRALSVLASEEHFLEEPVQAYEAFAVRALEALRQMLEVGKLVAALDLA